MYSRLYEESLKNELSIYLQRWCAYVACISCI